MATRRIAVTLALIATCAFFVAMYRSEMSQRSGDSPTHELRASGPDSDVFDSGIIGHSDDRFNRPTPQPPGNAEPGRPGQPWTIDDLLALNASGDELFSGNAELAQVQRDYATAQKIFVFPDGETITLTYDSTPTIYYESIEHLDDGVSAGFYGPLSEAAREGNAYAARTLFQQLKFCTARAASTREQLSERIQALRNAVMADGPSVEERITEERQDFRRCEGSNTEMMDASLELLRLAADAGDQMSAFLYASEVMNSHPDFAETYFRQAWSNGGINGLYGLSRILSDRAHISYEDAVTAHAHSLAWLAGRLALYDGLPEEVFTYERERLLIEWQELQASVSYPVVLDGTALAREILVNNPRCCTFQ